VLEILGMEAKLIEESKVGQDMTLVGLDDKYAPCVDTTGIIKEQPMCTVSHNNTQLTYTLFLRQSEKVRDSLLDSHFLFQ
jgi:hypothetical protein